MKRALLLNSDGSPLHFISDHDAITLFYKGRAEVVLGLNGTPSEWDETFKSPSTSIRVPATMRLFKKVHKKWKAPRFRKRVLFNRDQWSCQYCGEKLHWNSVTIDHVMPSSRGGKTSWHNCVTSCTPCNKEKADRTPDEAGMRLVKQPTYPSALDFWDAMRSNVVHEDWSMYLPKR